MTEQEYDEQIAPKLKEIAEQIKAMGGSMVARVEWANSGGEEGTEGVSGAGSTITGDFQKFSVAQAITYIAVLTNGNVDSLFINIMKTIDCSRTMVHSLFTKEST